MNHKSPGGTYYAGRVRDILEQFYRPNRLAGSPLDPYIFQTYWTQQALTMLQGQTGTAWPPRVVDQKDMLTKFTETLCTAILSEPVILAESEPVVAGAWYEQQMDALNREYPSISISAQQYTQAWFLKIMACIAEAQKDQKDIQKDQQDPIGSNIGIYTTPCPTP